MSSTTIRHYFDFLLLMRTDEFDFYLPEHLIAQHPPSQRGTSRLLQVNDNNLSDKDFPDFIDLIAPGDVLVLNDTRVIKARLFGHKNSGGKIEVLVERVLNEHEVWAQIRASHAPKAGSILHLAEQFDAEVLGRIGEFFHLRFLSEQDAFSLLEQHGQLPLPPYITHHTDSDDERRYQTVFARAAGAVAAPTAGLHFDETMLQTLKNKGIIICYVTLHVGAGTFQPVRVEHIHQHSMHSERYFIPQHTVDAIQLAHAQHKQVFAVGTTSLRAVESAAAQADGLQTGAGETRIFITPGFQFKVVDRLLTNFHLPKSTLLMLVSAFAGMENIRSAYQHAIAHQYRFFSYGDAMLLTRHDQTQI